MTSGAARTTCLPYGQACPVSLGAQSRPATGREPALRRDHHAVADAAHPLAHRQRHDGRDDGLDLCQPRQPSGGLLSAYEGTRLGRRHDWTVERLKAPLRPHPHVAAGVVRSAISRGVVQRQPLLQVPKLHTESVRQSSAEAAIVLGDEANLDLPLVRVDRQQLVET